MLVRCHLLATNSTVPLAPPSRSGALFNIAASAVALQWHSNLLMLLASCLHHTSSLLVLPCSCRQLSPLLATRQLCS